jgi:hypothetical protein
MASEMPHVLHQLSKALAALVAGLSDDERDELLAYLAGYRSRQQSRRRADGAT